MFGTLHMTSKKRGSPEFIARPKRTLGNDIDEFIHHRSACNNCRARKLRCDGNLDGCERCVNSTVICEYSQKARSRRSVVSNNGTRAAGEVSRKKIKPSAQIINENDSSTRPKTGTLSGPASSEGQEELTASSEDFSMIESHAQAFLGDCDLDFTFNSDEQFLTTSQELPDFPDFAAFLPPVGVPADLMSWSLNTPISPPTHEHFIFPSPEHLDKGTEASQREESSADSQLSRDAVQKNSKDHCSCLDYLFQLLEHLDNGPVIRKSSNLDSSLAQHKHALRCTQDVLKCRCCPNRAHCITLLVTTADKIISLSENIITAFVKYEGEHREKSGNGKGSSVSNSESGGGNLATLSSAIKSKVLHNVSIVTTAGQPSPPMTHDLQKGSTDLPVRELRMGEFIIETASERIFVIAPLIALQLKQQIMHLSKLQSELKRTNRQAQRERMESLEKRSVGMLSVIGGVLNWMSNACSVSVGA